MAKSRGQMRRVFFFLFLIAALSSYMSAQEARQLTVQVFSARSFSSLTISPLGDNEWIRACHTCERKALGAPLIAKVNAGSIVLSSGMRSQDIELEGSFRMQPDGAERKIAAAGVWRLKLSHGEMYLLLTLDSERYVALALNGEADPNEQLESLKAMAVTMRTYALENANRHSKEGFNLCDSTHCQALRFGEISPAIKEAVLETAGEMLWYRGRRATVFYTQNCGGESEDAGSVWTKLDAPYLKAHSDPYCARHALSQWHAEISVSQMQMVFRKQGWKLPSTIEAVHIAKRTRAGRVAELEFSGEGMSIPVTASSLRFAMDRSLGWNQLRSDGYTVSLNNGVLHFNGKGYGHGVGLCQAGAFEMATEGHSYREILSFYFPGTSIGITAKDSGWQAMQGSGLTLYTVAPQPALLQEAKTEWNRAQTLFPPRAPIKPVIRQFPTTELFRQSTGEPGWVLASAQGTKVFLQPMSVLQKTGREDGTLLHEFLHLLIEQESSPQAPLWLREGLVEALAEPAVSRSNTITTNNLDALLAHPASQADSQRAHTDAEHLAQSLLARYGLEQVRQWLRSEHLPDEVVRMLPQLESSPSTRP
jgi:stage II sporulation protein D